MQKVKKNSLIFAAKRRPIGFEKYIFIVSNHREFVAKRINLPADSPEKFQNFRSFLYFLRQDHKNVYWKVFLLRLWKRNFKKIVQMSFYK